MPWSDDTRCLQCNGKLPLYRKLKQGQFCSRAHEEQYGRDQEKQGLERLFATHSSLQAVRPQGGAESILGLEADAGAVAPVVVPETAPRNIDVSPRVPTAAIPSLPVTPAASEGTQAATGFCLHCRGKLPLFRRLKQGQFCSPAHQEAYANAQEQLGLGRLFETHSQLQALRPTGGAESILGPEAAFGDTSDSTLALLGRVGIGNGTSAPDPSVGPNRSEGAGGGAREAALVGSGNERTAATARSSPQSEGKSAGIAAAGASGSQGQPSAKRPPEAASGMCLHCGGRLPLFRKLQQGQFCSKAHQQEYAKSQDLLGLERLFDTHNSLQAVRPSAGAESILGPEQASPQAILRPVAEAGTAATFTGFVSAASVPDLARLVRQTGVEACRIDTVRPLAEPFPCEVTPQLVAPKRSGYTATGTRGVRWAETVSIEGIQAAGAGAWSSRSPQLAAIQPEHADSLAQFTDSLVQFEQATRRTRHLAPMAAEFEASAAPSDPLPDGIADIANLLSLLPPPMRSTNTSPVRALPQPKPAAYRQWTALPESPLPGSVDLLAPAPASQCQSLSFGDSLGDLAVRPGPQRLSADLQPCELEIRPQLPLSAAVAHLWGTPQPANPVTTVESGLLSLTAGRATAADVPTHPLGSEPVAIAQDGGMGAMLPIAALRPEYASMQAPSVVPEMVARLQPLAPLQASKPTEVQLSREFTAVSVPGRTCLPELRALPATCAPQASSELQTLAPNGVVEMRSVSKQAQALRRIAMKAVVETRGPVRPVFRAAPAPCVPKGITGLEPLTPFRACGSEASPRNVTTGAALASGGNPVTGILRTRSIAGRGAVGPTAVSVKLLPLPYRRAMLPLAGPGSKPASGALPLGTQDDVVLPVLRVGVQPLRTPRGSDPEALSPMDPLRGGILAVAAFWHNTPKDLKVLLFAIPLLAALAFYPSLPKVSVTVPDAGAAGSKAFGQAIGVQFAALRQTILERAAVALDEDFRQGLDEWIGKGGATTRWSFDATGFVEPGPLALYRPSGGLRDYKMEFLGMIEDKALSWVVRAADFQNYYVIKLVILRPGPVPLLGLVRYAVVDGKAQDRADAPVPIQAMADMLFRVRTEVHGEDFSVYVQDQLIDSWSEPRLQRGGVGLYTARDERSHVRWVQVTHQYDALGRLCAYLVPYEISNTIEDR